MNFEAVIGIEIHIELNTSSKMFSSAPIKANKQANYNVFPLDIAFPGAMPTINKQAVIHAIRIAHALHMNIDNELWFDRKNYFYSDNPKGYQITQYYRPLATNGYLDINNHRIKIEDLHLEEDTCKQVHLKDRTLLDYNRSGIPLIEIVSSCDIRSSEEAKLFVEKIHQIVTDLEASDGKMENGSLRCDINISLRPIGSNKNGNKVEIKNLNSFKNIKLAIDYEITRQLKLLLSGEIVEQQTRRFDENLKQTTYMREKGDSGSYGYFVDPNIPPITLDFKFINDAIASSPMSREEKKNKYLSLGLDEKDIKLILKDISLMQYFDKLLAEGAPIKLASNWINVNVQSVLKKEMISINSFKITPHNLASLLKLIANKEISNKQARQIFDKMLIGNANPNSIKEELGSTLNNDEREIKDIVKQIIIENPSFLNEYANGKTNIARFICGQVMKLTKGKADPQLTNKIVIELLKGN